MNKLSQGLDFEKNLLEKRNIKKAHKDRLERKYNIRRKRLNIVMQEMKQQIKAVDGKVKRFNSRINQSQQNRMFVNNQGRLFQRSKITNAKFQILWRHKHFGRVYGVKGRNTARMLNDWRTLRRSYSRIKVRIRLI